MPDPTIPPPLKSHAQNFEDVLLWRALKEVEAGFYIDIGAQEPVTDSVSLAFYERGWRGLHVEPNGHYAAKLRAARADEEVLQAIIAVKPDLAEFYEIENSGLSTADPAIAESHRKDGMAARKVSVPAVRLETLLDRFKDRDIHWMKIDVEGFERQVIESWGESAVRPWVLVVESTRPRTQEDDSDWEPMLLSRGYAFVHFDGLNRFYVSEAHADLGSRFGTGPNYFDDFIIAEDNFFSRFMAHDLRYLRRTLAERSELCAALEQGRAEDRTYIGHLEVALDRGKRDLAEARQTERLFWEKFDIERESWRRHAEQTQANADRLAARIHAMETSTSWKLTGPLRRLMRLVKGQAS